MRNDIVGISFLERCFPADETLLLNSSIIFQIIKLLHTNLLRNSVSRYTDACHNYKAKEKEKTSEDDRYSIEVKQPCGLILKACIKYGLLINGSP